jgi:hypothetical protein
MISEAQAAGPAYADFWKRVLAAIVDGILVNIPIAAVTWVVAPETFHTAEVEQRNRRDAGSLHPDLDGL